MHKKHTKKGSAETVKSKDAEQKVERCHDMQALLKKRKIKNLTTYKKFMVILIFFCILSLVMLVFNPWPLTIKRKSEVKSYGYGYKCQPGKNEEYPNKVLKNKNIHRFQIKIRYILVR